MGKYVQNFLTRHRGWVIFLFAVPFSFIYQKIEDFRSWIFRNFQSTNKFHEREVRHISNLVKKAHDSGQLMCTARSPWKTMSIRKATYKEDCAQIPINLKNILEIDETNQSLRVEPLVTMGDITHYLLPKGYALAVQVEMDDLTVGGLCMGIGIETSSHRYGFLFETIKSYEIVTADGQIINATRDTHPDLFHSLPMSHGTLGFLVSVELEIVKVKDYMKLRYIPTHTRQEFNKTMQELTDSDLPPDFLEALVYSPETAVIMIGEFANKPSDGKNINPINRWHKQWFYTYVESFLEKGEQVEYIPLRHYFHRHTSSIFFQLKDLIPFANKAWYRWLFAWMGAPKVSLMKYTMTKELRKRSLQNRVAQDIIIPISDMEEGLNFIDKHFEIYPLWVCPVKIRNKESNSGFIPKTNGQKEQIFVDLGIYGIPPSVKQSKWNGIETSRKLEEFVRDKNGFQMLYADIFMTRIEFEEMFDHNLYRKVRTKYHADKAFPEVYDKVIPEKWLINLEQEAVRSKEEAIV